MGLRLKETNQGAIRVGDIQTGVMFTYLTSHEPLMKVSSGNIVNLLNGYSYSSSGYANDLVKVIPKGSILEVE